MDPNVWKKHNFEVVMTGDGSPTLRSLHNPNNETMHHSGGAFSETLQIYGNPLSRGLDRGLRSVLSLGLGLGYNEFLVGHYAQQKHIADLCLHSFESDDFLVQSFLTYIHRGTLACEVEDIYQSISDRFALSPQHVLWLQQAYKSGQWKIHGHLDQKTTFDQRFEVILYDAFSSKSTAELWEESFLIDFINRACAPKCVFTTYACTGNLKRALKHCGFDLHLRQGFQSKRQSTLAVRELDLNEFV